MGIRTPLVIGATVVLVAGVTPAECDPAAGKVVFEAKRETCHVAQQTAAAAAGPNLHGVVGQSAVSSTGIVPLS